MGQIAKDWFVELFPRHLLARVGDEEANPAGAVGGNFLLVTAAMPHQVLQASLEVGLGEGRSAGRDSEPVG